MLSIPSLWTQIDFSFGKSDRAEEFIGRSGDQLLNVCQFVHDEKVVEPFLPSTLDNIHRLQWLEIFSFHTGFDRVLGSFASSAPELKHIGITNDPTRSNGEIKLSSSKFFGGRLPKLTRLSLNYLDTDLRGFNLPSLRRFILARIISISVRDLTSFFERCPLLEFIEISLHYTSEPPAPPPVNRVRLATLKELRFDRTASASGLLDHLILPKCADMKLEGQFTGEEFDIFGEPAARIHPSSIDHLPATREITKAVAMPNSCDFSGPNGDLRFIWSDEARGSFNGRYFTSLSPVFVLDIRELLVGQNTTAGSPWKQTVAGARGAFSVLTKVEDLTIVNCETGPLFAALGVAKDGRMFLPELQRLTIYVGLGNVKVLALIRCAEARKERSKPLGKVTVIFKEELGDDSVRELESLRAFVGELIYYVGAAPKLSREIDDNGETWLM